MVAWCFGGVFRDRYRVFLSVVYREGVAVAYKCPGVSGGLYGVGNITWYISTSSIYAKTRLVPY